MTVPVPALEAGAEVTFRVARVEERFVDGIACRTVENGTIRLSGRSGRAADDTVLELSVSELNARREWLEGDEPDLETYAYPGPPTDPIPIAFTSDGVPSLDPSSSEDDPDVLSSWIRSIFVGARPGTVAPRIDAWTLAGESSPRTAVADRVDVDEERTDAATIVYRYSGSVSEQSAPGADPRIGTLVGTTFVSRTDGLPERIEITCRIAPDLFPGRVVEDDRGGGIDPWGDEEVDEQAFVWRHLLVRGEEPLAPSWESRDDGHVLERLRWRAYLWTMSELPDDLSERLLDAMDRLDAWIEQQDRAGASTRESLVSALELRTFLLAEAELHDEGPSESDLEVLRRVVLPQGCEDAVSQLPERALVAHLDQVSTYALQLSLFDRDEQLAELLPAWERRARNAMERFPRRSWPRHALAESLNSWSELEFDPRAPRDPLDDALAATRLLAEDFATGDGPTFRALATLRGALGSVIAHAVDRGWPDIVAPTLRDVQMSIVIRYSESEPGPLRDVLPQMLDWLHRAADQFEDDPHGVSAEALIELMTELFETSGGHRPES